MGMGRGEEGEWMGYVLGLGLLIKKIMAHF